MKKKISTLILALILCFSVSAHAFVPLVIPAWAWIASAGLHVAGAAAGLYYYLNQGGSASVSAAGSVSNPSTAVWVDLTGPVPTVVEKNLNASVSASAMQQLVLASPESKSKYPLLAEALQSGAGSLFIEDMDSTKYPVGTKILLNDGTYVSTTSTPVTTADRRGYTCAEMLGGKSTIYYPSGIIVNCIDVPGGGDLDSYNTAPVVAPPKVPAPPATVASRLSSESTLSFPKSVDSKYNDELDKMMQDPNYVPVFTDDTTGLPFEAPASTSVMTPQQMAVYNANGAKNEALAAATAAANTNATNTAAAATAANATAAAATAASAAAPGDATLAAAAAAATTAAAAANAAAGTASAVAAQAAAAQAAAVAAQALDDAAIAPSLPGDNTYDAEITAPAKKGIGDLLASFVSGSPLISMVQSFTISTSNASGVVPIGNIYGQDLSFDFTRWESTLRACGGVLIIIMHGFAIFIVVRGW